MKEYSYVGKSIPRVDANDKVTGEAVYSSDISLPGTLIGKCKRSPYPFARILSIDISKALKLPGVRAVISPQNIAQFPYGEPGPHADQFVLCDQYARYVGDEVAAVAAIDSDTAEEALDLIAVEYEVLEPVFDPEKAIEAGAPVVHPELEGIKQNVAYQIDFVRGDGEAAFKQADVVLEERFSTQSFHQCYLEPRNCLADWQGSDRLTIWATTQSPFLIRGSIARALGIAEHQVRIIPSHVGGGFGNSAMRIFPIAALLARKTGKPVKMVLTREEDFISGRPCLPEVIDLRLGFKSDGTMIAKSQDIMADTGAYVGSCRGVLAVSVIRPDCVYRLPNIKTSAKLVYTNNIPRGPLRGFGNPQAAFAMESMVDMAAEKLGIDPVEIRLKNATQKGDITTHGWLINSCGLSESIQRAAEESGWQEKRKVKGKRYGIGMACANHVASNRNVLPLFDGSAAIVRIDQYGKVQVISGETEIGQGSTTVFSQIAAEELGVGIEDVTVLPVDTDVSPFAIGTFGSRVTVVGGNAVLMAAADAKKQLLSHAARILKTNADDIDLKNGKFYTKGSLEAIATAEGIAHRAVLEMGGFPITGRGAYVVPDYVVVADKQTHYGNCSIGYTFLTQVAEVSVDVETGKVDLLNFWSAIDLGKAINPKACEAQTEGGVMMGAGYSLSEDYFVEGGRTLNPNFKDYRLPGFSSVPQINSIFIETNNPGSPYGAKSIGEAVTDPTAPAIANAIYDAVGVRIKELPVTPEKLLAALREKNRR